MSFFSAKGLSAGYGSGHIFAEVSFDLSPGTLVGILGANGSGKTTLLKAICGILPHDGTCELDGMALEGLSARNISRLCSYSPQRSGITMDISVLDVVLMGFNPRLGLLLPNFIFYYISFIFAAFSVLKMIYTPFLHHFCIKIFSIY